MKSKIIILLLILIASCNSIKKEPKKIVEKPQSEIQLINAEIFKITSDKTLIIKEKNNHKTYFRNNKKVLDISNRENSLSGITTKTLYQDAQTIVLKYDKNILLGIAYQDVNGEMIKGTEITYNENAIMHYKSGKLNGLTLVYNSYHRKQLIKKMLFKNDEIIWRETIKPNSKTEYHHCDFKNGKPFNGIEYEGFYSNDEMYFKDGKLYKEIRYKTENGIAKIVRVQNF